MQGTRPTLDDVARVAGVSRMTVSNVYGHPDRVSSATRDRVMRAAGDLGYTGPSPAGRTLRRGSSGVIGLLIGDALEYLFADPGAAAFMQGMANEAAARDLSIQIINAAGPTARRKVHDAVVDSWVTFGVPTNNDALAAVTERRQRMVTAPGPRLTRTPLVTIDAAAGARIAVEHLIGLGHQHLAVVTPPRSGSPTWGQRATGARSAVESAGLRWADVLDVEAPENSRTAGRSIAAPLLDRLDLHPSLGVFAATDVLALGVLDTARDLGVEVPGRMSIVGFDDIDEASYCTPPLTTIHQDLRAQGASTVRFASIDSLPRRLVDIHPTHLVVRGSTAAPPSTGRRRTVRTR